MPVAAQENRVADSLLVHGDDLATEVEPGEDLVRQPADLVEDGSWRSFGPSEKSAYGRVRGRADLLGGNDRQRSGPEAMLLVQAEVLGAVREGEEPGLTDVPARERLEDGLQAAGPRCRDPRGRDRR